MTLLERKIEFAKGLGYNFYSIAVEKLGENKFNELFEKSLCTWKSEVVVKEKKKKRRRRSLKSTKNIKVVHLKHIKARIAEGLNNKQIGTVYKCTAKEVAEFRKLNEI